MAAVLALTGSGRDAVHEDMPQPAATAAQKLSPSRGCGSAVYGRKPIGRGPSIPGSDATRAAFSTHSQT